MSSSPMAPSSVHQAARISKQSSSSSKLHQTVYDDGRSRCIVEFRRRSKMVRDIDANHIGQSAQWPKPERNVMESPKCRYSSGSQNPSPAASSTRREGLAAPRDGYAKLSSRKTRTVVIVPVSSKMNGPNFERSFGGSKQWIEPTPPPTPRLRRLPSPELSDLDEAPFCECDEAALKRYCNACKKDIDPLMEWT
jgi:hypothetical protein